MVEQGLVARVCFVLQALLQHHSAAFWLPRTRPALFADCGWPKPAQHSGLSTRFVAPSLVLHAFRPLLS